MYFRIANFFFLYSFIRAPAEYRQISVYDGNRIRYAYTVKSCRDAVQGGSQNYFVISIISFTPFRYNEF